MRKTFTALVLVVLAGCTTSGLEKDQPSLAARSEKSPQQFAKCLAPKWLDLNSSTSSVETESGYKIAASAMYTGVVALAVVDKDSTGSSVRVFLPMEWAGTRWTDTAKACI